MANADTVAEVGKKFQTLGRWTRLWAACEAAALGRGGVTAVWDVSDDDPGGIVELQDPQGRREAEPAGRQRVRRAGGGRKRLSQRDRKLCHLEALVDGDPQSPLRWTCKSTGTRGWPRNQVSYRTVAALLHGLHPNDARGGFSSRRSSTSARKSVRSQQPVVSVDTKKKELVGDFRNVGLEWQPQGSPDKVRVHDFKDKELGKAIPYGIYDITNNEGWVSVGIDHDTAQFATATLKRSGTRCLPQGHTALDHRRRRREQWVEKSLMEGGLARTRRWTSV